MLVVVACKPIWQNVCGLTTRPPTIPAQAFMNEGHFSTFNCNLSAMTKMKCFQANVGVDILLF
jgi:hypothetical protein